MSSEPKKSRKRSRTDSRSPTTSESVGGVSAPAMDTNETTLSESKKSKKPRLTASRSPPSVATETRDENLTDVVILKPDERSPPAAFHVPSECQTMDREESSASEATVISGQSEGSVPSDDRRLSDIELSRGRRQMLEVVDKLHGTGVQIDVDIPQIAVIGSQSTGKSSLIEAISGITLPRSAGTCTRCPLECRLSGSSAPWRCEVSLKFTTDTKGTPLGQARHEVFGPSIFDSEGVEERVRRAQRAILNPSTSPGTFLEGGDEDPQRLELGFSMNCVSLKISGPEIADLSFVDLPGLIASVSSRRKPNDISLVENLVTSYISKPSCIILLTVACETDFENQGAHNLAKKYDPEGKRTIGVLTKPDRIPAGEEEGWMPYIRNEKASLANNWYCVRLASSEEMHRKGKKGGARARRRERRFFEFLQPWSTIDPVYREYLGSFNLVRRLSSILSDLISERLPAIHQEIDNAIAETHRNLDALPKEAPVDAVQAVRNLINQLNFAIARQVDGTPMALGPESTVLWQGPNFRPYERALAGKQHLGYARFLAQEEAKRYDDESSDPEDTEDKGDTDPDNDEIEDPDAEERAVNKKPSAPAIEVVHVTVKRKKVYIDEVTKRIKLARTRELQGNVPYKVSKALILETVKQWRTPAIELCRETYLKLGQCVRDLSRDHLRSFGQGKLEQLVNDILQKRLDPLHQSAVSRIDRYFKGELNVLTLNERQLTMYKTDFLQYYREERFRNLEKGALSQPLEAFSRGERRLRQTPEKSSEVGQPLTAPQVGCLVPTDATDPGLMIMAEVQAYFHVAHKRFTDVIVMFTDTELVQGLVESDIVQALSIGLGIDGPNAVQTCVALAEEHPKIGQKRALLKNKLARLEIARGELMAARADFAGSGG